MRASGGNREDDEEPEQLHGGIVDVSASCSASQRYSRQRSDQIQKPRESLEDPRIVYAVHTSTYNFPSIELCAYKVL